jgi:hypothetical protein
MFIPRHPVIENQFCSYAENTSFGSAGVGGVIAYAGSVVFLDPAAVNEEPMVKRVYYACGEAPFGLLEQKVKVGYHQVHPTGFMMPGDLGSSDAIAQAYYNTTGDITGHKSIPVAVAHLGIWDTIHYTCKQDGVAGTVDTGWHMKPGMSLHGAGGTSDHAKLTNSTTNSNNTADNQGERFSTDVVARVVKGASLAKCQANISNTTLYPIRVKLLI